LPLIREKTEIMEKEMQRRESHNKGRSILLFFISISINLRH